MKGFARELALKQRRKELGNRPYLHVPNMMVMSAFWSTHLNFKGITSAQIRNAFSRVLFTSFWLSFVLQLLLGTFHVTRGPFNLLPWTVYRRWREWRRVDKVDCFLGVFGGGSSTPHGGFFACLRATFRSASPVFFALCECSCRLYAELLILSRKRNFFVVDASILVRSSGVVLARRMPPLSVLLNTFSLSCGVAFSVSVNKYPCWSKEKTRSTQGRRPSPGHDHNIQSQTEELTPSRLKLLGFAVRVSCWAKDFERTSVTTVRNRNDAWNKLLSDMLWKSCLMNNHELLPSLWTSAYRFRVGMLS